MVDQNVTFIYDNDSRDSVIAKNVVLQPKESFVVKSTEPISYSKEFVKYDVKEL